MNYFHDTLLRYGFAPVRLGFYRRDAPATLSGTLYCLAAEDGRPRQLLLWQAHRVLLQGDVVTLLALQQVLDRLLESPAPAA